MNRFIFTILFFSIALVSFPQTDTLYVSFIAKPPFVQSENGQTTGIDIDILSEYANWLRTKKKMDLVVKPVSFTSESACYSFLNTTKNCVAAGAITSNALRAKEVDFTSGYLKNVAFCITNGNAPDIKTKNASEVMKTLGSMTGLTIPSTGLSNYMNEIRKLYINDLKIKEMTDQTKMLDEVSRNVLNFTYVDAVIFWFYLKSNPQKFLKMQKPLNQDKEQLCYAFPKGSPHKAMFNEFFSGAGGFKTQKNYRTILEKYLGSYMTQNMAVN